MKPRGFVIGDVVQLRSGGPAMTVCAVQDQGQTITCSWFALALARYKKTAFDVRLLQPVAGGDVPADEGDQLGASAGDQPDAGAAFVSVQIGDRLDLWAHLVAVHACCMPTTATLAELQAYHTHDHAPSGPGPHAHILQGASLARLGQVLIESDS